MGNAGHQWPGSMFRNNTTLEEVTESQGSQGELSSCNEQTIARDENNSSFCDLFSAT